MRAILTIMLFGAMCAFGLGLVASHMPVPGNGLPTVQDAGTAGLSRFVGAVSGAGWGMLAMAVASSLIVFMEAPAGAVITSRKVINGVPHLFPPRPATDPIKQIVDRHRDGCPFASRVLRQVSTIGKPRSNAACLEDMMHSATGHPAPWTEREISTAYVSQLTRCSLFGDETPIHRKAVAALFAAATSGKADLYDGTRAKLSGAFGARTEGLVHHDVATEAIAAVVEALGAAQVRSFLARREESHAFSETALMSVLARARTKRFVPAVDFGWLRSVDPRLFTVLSEVGRTNYVPEALGAASHWKAELALGKAIPLPSVGPAVRSSLRYLEESARYASS